MSDIYCTCAVPQYSDTGMLYCRCGRMKPRNYVFAQGVRKSAVTVQEIQDYQTLQSKHTALLEQVEKLAMDLETIKTTYCGCWDNCRCGSDKLNEIAKQALASFEAWKKENG